MKIKVTHCSNCPCSDGFYKVETKFTGYICNADPNEPKCVIYTDKDPDTIKPDNCPLVKSDVVITRG